MDATCAKFRLRRESGSVRLVHRRGAQSQKGEGEMNIATFGLVGPALACVDAKGRDVMVGNTVVDSFGELHTVAKIVPQSSRQAYLVDTEGKAMMPWLTELVPLVELVEGTL